MSRQGSEWAITGDLTINGTSRAVTVVFEETGSAKDPYGNLRVGFEGGTTINRTDWGLGNNAALETGGVLVSEKVKARVRHLGDRAVGLSGPRSAPA